MSYKTVFHLRVTSIVLFAILILFLISCVKKTTDVTREGTIEKIRNVPVGFPPSENSFDVTIECDKKSNKPVPFQKVFKVDKKTTTATVKGNNLNITNSQKDTVWVPVPCKDTVKWKDRVVEKKIVMWPWWVVPLIIYAIVATCLAGYLFLRKIFI
jgi:hypothetical protein